MAAAETIVHLELVHPDPDAVLATLSAAFGARQVESRLSNWLEQIFPGGRCVHARVGNVVFQIIRPTEAMPTWHAQLEEHGPSVHNITFYVDDLEESAGALLDRGAETVGIFEMPFSQIGLGGEQPTKVHVLDARKQTGLRFELLERVDGWEPGELP